MYGVFIPSFIVSSATDPTDAGLTVPGIPRAETRKQNIASTADDTYTHLSNYYVDECTYSDTIKS